LSVSEEMPMLKQFRILRALLMLAAAFWSWQALPSGSVRGFAFAEDNAAHNAEAAPGGEHAAADEHDAAGHGAPQGPIDWRSDLALWSLVVFGLFVLVLYKMAWGPLIVGLDKREARIRQNIHDAEVARTKSEQMLAEYKVQLSKVHDEVREILAEARRDAERTRQDILSAAEQEAAAHRQRAVREIEQVRDQALDELFANVATMVEKATEHVLGRSLTGADQERLVNEALAEFATRRAEVA
jgi:F-type H+-transporting ATPase subunit b